MSEVEAEADGVPMLELHKDDREPISDLLAQMLVDALDDNDEDPCS